MGVVEPCGLGDSIEHPDAKSVDALKEDCLASNRTLIKALQESEFANQLMDQAVADARLGRMTMPVKGVLIPWRLVHVLNRFLQCPATMTAA